jgi:nucleoside-diphosphate-sugar epimerase
MKILIIGGTGLISTAITAQLLAQGHQLTLYNRGKTEARVPGSVAFMVGDRQQFAAFEAQMAEAGHFDCVIDMVCYTPEEAASAVRAFKGRVGQFVFCSTVDVYRRPAVRLPYREDEPQGSNSLYGQRKTACEQVLMAAHAEGGLPVTIIRPAHTYGEGGRVIHSLGWGTAFLDRIRKGKPIVVHGDGNSLWVSCHIDDVARAFVNAVGNPTTFGNAYHTTGEEWQTWDQYHVRVAEALGAPPPTLVHIPTDLLVRLAPDRATVTLHNFQYSNVFDNSAAKADLGFRYTIPWVEGVRRTVAWLDERHLILDSDTDPVDDQIIAAWQAATHQMIAAVHPDTR